MIYHNDQDCINAVLAGDTQSFSFLVERYKDAVFTWAVKIVKSREEAEEVSQDSFVKAFRSLQSFKGDAKFSTWLYKIVYHNCIDRVKEKSTKI